MNRFDVLRRRVEHALGEYWKDEPVLLDSWTLAAFAVGVTPDDNDLFYTSAPVGQPEHVTIGLHTRASGLISAIDLMNLDEFASDDDD